MASDSRRSGARGFSVFAPRGGGNIAWRRGARGPSRFQIVIRGRLAGIVKAPVGIRLRGSVRSGIGVSARFIRTLCRWIGLGSHSGRQQRARIGGRAHLAVILIAAHDITKGEKNAREQEHQHEQTDDVSALQHALAGSPASTSRCHSYFCCPPNDCTQLLMISMGSGNTMVVFFSTPISVRVCR